MGQLIKICPKCGHLSPSEWDECHHCSKSIDRVDSRTLSELNDYYRRLEKGYGQFVLKGYYLIIAAVAGFMFLSFITTLLPIDSTVRTQLSGAIVILMFLFGWAGLGMVLGGNAILKGKFDLSGSQSGGISVMLKGVGVSIVLFIILGILIAIPLVNVIVTVVVVGVIVVSPFLAYRFRNRIATDRATATGSLLSTAAPEYDRVNSNDSVHESAVRNRERTNATTTQINSDRDAAAARTALAVLTEIPSATVTPTHQENLRRYLERRSEAGYPLIATDELISAVANVYDNAADAEKAELVDLILNRAERFRLNNQLDEATTALEIAEELISTLGVEKSTLDMENSLETIREYVLQQRFDDKKDELFDLIRSGERALEVNQYETALKRFQTVADGLPPELEDTDDLTREQADLIGRLTDGLQTAGQERLLTRLPASPTPYEQELLQLALPKAAATNLEEIYSGSVEPEVYRTLASEEMLEEVSRAATIIDTYRDAREMIQNATTDPKPYLERLNGIIDTHLADIDPLDTSHEALLEAIEPGIAYANLVAQIERLTEQTPPPAIESCLDSLRTALKTRTNLTTESDFKNVQTVLTTVESASLYMEAFPSLSIDTIIEEIAARIENGEPLTPGSFVEEQNRINRLVEQEVETLATEVERFLHRWEGHPAINYREWQDAIAEARRTGDPEPLLEPYQTLQRMEGQMWSRNQLHQFSWEAFEHLVASLYEQRGYETTVTSGSRDLGVDVWAENDIERLAIQVKQFSEGNTVGRETIQKLESTLARGDADRIVVVTSSSFARTAEEYAARSENVELINGTKLINQLTRYSVPVSDVVR